MLYSLHKNSTPSFAVESVINDLRQIVARRMQSHFDKNVFGFDTWIAESFDGNHIKQHVVKHLPELPNNDEWITLILAIVPHVQPDFFGSLISEHLPSGGDFPEFGGIKANNHRGLLP